MDTCTGSGSQRFLVDPSVQLVTLEIVVVGVVVGGGGGAVVAVVVVLST
jgi:hypothetical protein